MACSGDKVPDSARRSDFLANKQGLLGGAIGGAIGGFPGAAIGAGAEMGLRAVTNPAASAGMNLLKKFAAHAPHTRNYLLRSEAVPPRAGTLSLGNLATFQNQSQANEPARIRTIDAARTAARSKSSPLMSGYARH